MRHFTARFSRPSSLTPYASLFVLLALVLSACSAAGAPQPTAAPATSLTVKLSFVHNIEFAGFYNAADSGYYTGKNLKVTLEPLGEKESKADVMTYVEDGRAHFGIASADSLLMARSQGKPFVGVAVIYQRSPNALVSMADKNIVKPEDLKGKKIMIGLKGPLMGPLKVLLKEHGVPEDSVTFVEATGLTNDELISGNVDVRTGFINNQPVELALKGHQTNAILFSDYGIDMYANVIFTTEDMIAKNPDAVAGFVAATVQGFQDMVAQPAEAAKRTVAWNPTRKLDFETEAAQRALPLINPAGSQVGMMKPDRWDYTHNFLVEQGLLKTPLDVKSAYTLTFLDKYYTATSQAQ